MIFIEVTSMYLFILPLNTISIKFTSVASINLYSYIYRDGVAQSV